MFQILSTNLDISEPPFQVKETGYAGFEIPIQIYFKNREKPNHLVFVHDLSLLANKSNNASTIEKIKFINPNREFEKCLIKSGAQLLTAPVKKERSDSPPAKKQKSSSLIPSKDMSKQQLHQQIQQQQIQQQQQQLINHQQSQQQPQQQQQLQPHSQPQPQQNHNQNHQSKPHTSKSKEFIDIFGAPLAYNGKSNPLLDIKTKISSLSDCDRLQKIVDIIEEAGEWFNLTPKKFEFDLKRLDKKTLHRIERCLTR